MYVTSRSRRALTMFVGVVELRYQHHTILCGVDNGVPQLLQTQPESFDLYVTFWAMTFPNKDLQFFVKNANRSP